MQLEQADLDVGLGQGAAESLIFEGPVLLSQAKQFPEQLHVDEAEVTPTASFQEDLGADSLDVVELVMQFEEAFDLEIPDEDAEKIKTVKDAIDYIEKNAKGGK